MCPRYRVLGIAAMRLHHLMERSNSVALFELGNALADLVDEACNVVALVCRWDVGHPFRHFPVLGVAPRVRDLDHHLAWLGLGDGRVDDLDLWSGVDDGFLHGCVFK